MRRVKLSHDEILRRLRLGDLRRLIEDRCHRRILPDDDAGREYLKELLLPISCGPAEAIKRPRGIELWGPGDRMRHEIEQRAPWLSRDAADLLLDEIQRMPTWERKPKARILGQRLNVPYAERQRLQLRTIGPCDITEKAMELIQKQKRRQQARLRRQAQGAQARIEYLAEHSVNKDKSWLGQGISRRTYYYRLKQTNCTSPYPINLTKAEHEPVQQVKCEGSKPVTKEVSDCVRLMPATPAGQSWTSVSEAEWLSIWSEEAAWALGWEPERAAA